MGVGGSTKIMNYKFFSMNVTNFLKKITPAVVLFVVILGALNAGTYDPYNELTVLTPEVARASLVAPSLAIPSLTTPTLSAPTLTTPELSAPVLEAPELSTPELSVPELSVPELSTPELEVPTLETPTLTVPTLTVPSLTVPTVTVPTVTVPTVTVPQIATTTSSLKTCNVFASAQTVYTGSSVTITWTTNGYASVTLNGETVSGLSGSKTFTNVQANTTFTLEAKTADGKQNCITNVTVLCVPPPVTLSCTELGYDFTAAKFTWNGNIYVKDSGRSDYQITVAGNDYQANWTSNKAIAAIIAEAGNTHKVFSNNLGLSGTISKCDIGSGCNKITKIQFCGNDEVIIPAPTCTLTPATKTINVGESVDLSWTTTNAKTASLSTFGAVALNGTKNTGALTSNTNYILSVVGNNGDTVKCHSNITVVPKEVKYCELTLEKSVSSTTANPGDELTYTVKIKNTGTADCTGGGVKIVDIHDANITYLSQTHTSNLNAGYENNPAYVAATKTLYWNGNTLTPGEEGTIVWKGKVNDNLACDTTTIIKNTAKATAKELNNFSVWAYSNTVETSAHKTCNVPVASCDAFGVSPTTITRGNSATLSWATTNATRVVIDNTIGEVAATGTVSITPLATTTYTLTAYGVNNQKNTCAATIAVEQPPVVGAPSCDAFTATPASLPIGGGNVTLAWATTNATGVSIAPTIGSVALNGSTTIGITTTQTFTLTAANASSSDSCVVTVPVQPPVPTPLSCSANVTLGANPNSISRGGESTLTWTTTGVTGVSFDNGITATGLSGSTTVSPSDSTTYTLTATNGTETINCPVAVTVRTGGGGGGGGSSSPRCELSISDNKINPGDDVVLTWESTRATDITLEDETEDDVLVTTSGLLSSAKDRLLDGKITVSPEEDTTYVLTVKRGSTTRKCTVDVEVDDNIVLTEVRDQPLVAGIALTQVPYTGFEAGPILTLLFYTLLMAWALYVAYLLVIKRDVIGGLKLAGNTVVEPSSRFIPEQVRPDVFVANVKAPEMPISTLPANLPIGTTPAVGYVNHVEDEVASTEVASHQIDDNEMTKIENHAHAQHVLLSSDAIRHFIATTNTTTERTIALDQVIVAAKAQFPAEDGWVVLNEKRMQELCVVCAVNAQKAVESTYIPAVVPQGAGSLAEAIVTGNVVAAYELIGNRPMFALADAAADFDAVYRIRRGIEAKASELLMKETATLTNDQILKMIEALTGALDGAYNDEASAVKMAIMKAIKVVA